MRVGFVALFLCVMSLCFAYDGKLSVIDERLLDAVWDGNIKKVQSLLAADGNPDAISSNNRTPLTIAILKNDRQMVSLLLDAGADPNLYDGYTCPIHKALGNRELLSYLISRGASIESVDVHGMTPLMLAAEKNLIDTVVLLIEYGASLDAKDTEGNTALHFARYHSEIIRILIESGANPAIMNYSGYEILDAAVSRDDIDLVNLVLEKGVLPDSRPHSAKPVLMAASEYSNARIGKALLTYGANPNVAFENGKTPLHVLGEYGEVRNAEILFDELISSGADVSRRDSSGDTPFISACRRGKNVLALALLNAETGLPEEYRSSTDDLNNALCIVLGVYHNESNQKSETSLVAQILVRGGRCDIPDQDENLPLWIALENSGSNDREILSLLLGSGAHVSGVNPEGMHPLCFAAHRDYTDAVVVLIEHGAVVDERGSDGSTALMHARSLVGTRVLVEAGADIQARDDKGLMAIHYAARGYSLERVQYLLDSGADYNALSFDGISPLCEAIDAGNGAVVVELLQRGASPYFKYADGSNPLLRFLMPDHDRYLQGRTACRKAVSLLLEAGIRADEESVTGESALLCVMRQDSLDQDAEILAMLKNACTPIMVAAAEKRLRDEARARNLEEAPENIGQSLAIMAFPMLLTGLSVAMREYVYQGNPSDNWMGSVNSVIGMGAAGFLCGGAVGYYVAAKQHHGAGDGLGAALGIAFITVGGAVVGSVVGGVTGSLPPVRTAFKEIEPLYYAPSAAALLTGLTFSVKCWLH